MSGRPRRLATASQIPQEFCKDRGDLPHSYVFLRNGFQIWIRNHRGAVGAQHQWFPWSRRRSVASVGGDNHFVRSDILLDAIQPVVLRMLPDDFDQVELGTVGRQIEETPCDAQGASVRASADQCRVGFSHCRAPPPSAGRAYTARATWRACIARPVIRGCTTSQIEGTFLRDRHGTCFNKTGHAQE